jgi:hypothetical protein
MNGRVRQASDVLHGTVDRVRSWFNPPLGADARPLEVREAILERIEARVEPAGDGRRVLPFDRVSVAVIAPDRETRTALEAALGDVEQAAVSRLAEIRCQRPGGFRVHVEYLKRPRHGWADDQRIDVRFDRSTAAAPSAPVCHVTIVRGAASQESYAFTDRQILIGRTADPVDHRGRTRHNQVAFVDDGDAVNRTVGRAHASIRYELGQGEYRLFDDGSHNGTQVVREGVVMDVTPRDPIGVVLMSGDEIRLGTAAIRIRVETPTSPGSSV